MNDIADASIDAALADIEIHEPDNGNSGAPAILADTDPEAEADVDRLIDDLVIFATARNDHAVMEMAA